ncbi:MAG TPA: hypothetical protein VMU16_03930 [Candidatus Binataceae bacterium]|nr:hypothetical protein [Candidatus Binataceae bacterium]
MRSAAKILRSAITVAAIAALSSCMTPPANPYANMNKGGAAPVGSSSNWASQESHPNYAPPSSSGTVVDGVIDSSQSNALTDYLKNHHLPLVKAQVVNSPSAGTQVILFGFVASDFGKSDAEHRTRVYLKDSALVVDNRIKVSPALWQGNQSGAPTGSNPPTDSSDPYASSAAIQDYQNTPGVDAYMAQQSPQYSSGPPPSMLLLMLPFLLGGSSGGSFGTFSGGYSPGYSGSYGGYSPGYGGSYGGGYPSSTPPPPTWGAPASPWP